MDDDLAVHEGVDLAVVGEGPLLVEADRDRLAGLDVAGVEAAPAGRRVGDLLVLEKVTWSPLATVSVGGW